MKKRMISFSILLIMLSTAILGITTNTVSASSTNSDTSVASGNCGENITWSLNSNGLLTITGEGAMSGSECAWANYNDQVKEVKFVGNITSISANAFESNTNLTSIVLPDTLTSIGRRAFAECTNLKNVTFPKGLITVGTSAFYKCTALEQVDLPEDLLYLNEYAFAECTSLKNIIIRASTVLVGDDEQTIYSKAIISGYKYSGAFYYARFYGRTFTDLSTNETTTEKITNQSYLDALPTTNVKPLGITSHNGRSYSGNVLKGYTVEFCHEKETNNETYKQIKAKVDELITGCTTQKEKARAIFEWAFYNIDYQYAYGANATIESVYRVFEELKGSCEAYTMLTNYMLYLCGIPTATVSNLTHEWSAAYVDGEWIYIDSTHGIFDKIPSDNKANVMSFAYDGKLYVIDDPSEGMKVSKIIESEQEPEEEQKPTNIPIDIKSYLIDYNIYTTLKSNKDLKTAFGNNEGALKNHWETYGIKEGRIASLVFDAKYYLERYTDLKKAYGNDYTKAYEHFIKYGINEGRQGSLYFNAKYYIENNKDLKEAYETNYSKALEHFVKYGIKEGRRGSAEFNVKLYRENYEDLRKAYGTDYKEYYKHYIDYGKAEGRNGLTEVVRKLSELEEYFYNEKVYTSANKDIRELYKNDSTKTKNHWIKYGIRDGRKASLVFDAKYYLDRYPDLKEAYGNDYTKAYEHFIKYGIKEGRQGSMYFSAKYYLERYPDLKEAFGTDYIKALKHFVDNGIRESRVGSAEFNVKNYRANYKDLNEAFGDNYLDYYIHYMNNGIKEDRRPV